MLLYQLIYAIDTQTNNKTFFIMVLYVHYILWDVIMYICR